MANEVRKPRGRKPRKKSDVFISWSGNNSKEIAGALKNFLETKVFATEKIRKLQVQVGHLHGRT